MLIIGSDIDDNSERIIKYLSETYGVNINAVSFSFYKAENEEFLTRNYLIEPVEVSSNQMRKSKSKRKQRLSIEEFLEIGSENGVKELLSYAIEKLNAKFDYRTTSLSTITFIGIMDGRRNTILNLQLFPRPENPLEIREGVQKLKTLT